MVKIAFVGAFAARLAEPVRSRLTAACEVIEGDETSILAKLADVDVLVTMGFSDEMAKAAPRLRLVQVPGAGLDRIDRTALRPETWLADAYGPVDPILRAARRHAAPWGMGQPMGGRRPGASTVA